MKTRPLFPIFLLLFSCLSHLQAQGVASFDVSFRVDTESAEELLNVMERRSFSTVRLVDLRGTRLASATSLLLARTTGSDVDFRRAVELFRDGTATSEDRYGLADSRSAVPRLRKLLNEIQRRQLDRRVRATLAPYFPPDIHLSASFSVYVVAFGNERAAAFVRRVVWNGNSPAFVGEDEGEPVIVLNLSRCLGAPTLEGQFTDMLAVLAHECFHAAYGHYQRKNPAHRSADSPLASLADLVQNEGIAYLLSQQIRIGGDVPSQPWFTATARAVTQLHRVFDEISSPGLTPSRTRELLLNSNLSGSFEGNYGATAGLRIAYEISAQLGHPALVETISGGSRDFFSKYQRIARRSGLPPLSVQLRTALHIEDGDH